MHAIDQIERILRLETAPVVVGLGLAVLMLAGLALLVFRGRRRRSIRRAREAADEVAGHGVLVAQSCGRVLEANVLARRLLWPDQTGKVSLVLPEPIRRLLSDPSSQQHTLRVGEHRLFDLAIPAARAAGAPRGIVLRDVTEDRRGRDHLLQLAHFDSLTGLGNRRLFIDRLKLAIQRAREAGGSVALLYIDIDRFKEVNDSLGHGAGDELLKSVASRFRHQTRVWQEKAIGGESFVARLSGDEFAIVVLSFEDASEIQRLAQAILEALAQPVSFEGRTIPCSASMGVSLHPDHGLDVEDLVKAADAALYAAKENGRGRFVIYEPALTAQAEYNRKLEQGLRQAIETGELRLYYQPKIEVGGGTVAGFEALLRWYNETLGFVSPREFIPIAEQKGLICEIGAWCIDEACRQLRIWREAGFDTVPVSVNVSSAQFAGSNLQEVITSALVRHDVDPGSLEIELTESLILADNETTALALRDLRAIGIRVALDDFGTGYSALTYLNRFPLDTVKMDRGFLRGIEDDESAAGIAAAVISMSHSLGFEVVAEGVDCERQSQLLWSMGCDQIQGFLYAPALPPLEATRFLAPVGGSRPVVDASRTAATSEPTAAPADPTGSRSGGRAWAPEVAARPRRGASRAALTRTLMIDDEQGSFGPVAVRLMRLGADVHLVQGLDEAFVFVDQDEPTLELLVVSPSIDLNRLAALRESVEKTSPEARPRVLAIGNVAGADGRRALREARIDWLIAGTPEEADLRFFVGAASFHGSRSRSQRAVRVPLDTTAWIRAGGERRVGTLTNLSRRGAFVETDEPYQIGQPVRLEFKAGDKQVRVFGNVAYQLEKRPPRGAGIGVVFYEADDQTTDRIDAVIEQIWSGYRP